MRRAIVVSSCALLLLAPSPGSAQAPQSFADLALRINLDDKVRIVDQSGVKAKGRLTRLTRSDLAIQDDAGEKRFTIDTVGEVAVHGHPLGKGALIGAAVFAVLGVVACSQKEDPSAGCFIVRRRTASALRSLAPASVFKPACSKTWRFASTSTIGSGSRTSRGEGPPAA